MNAVMITQIKDSHYGELFRFSNKMYNNFFGKEDDRCTISQINLFTLIAYHYGELVGFLIGCTITLFGN